MKVGKTCRIGSCKDTQSCLLELGLAHCRALRYLDGIDFGSMFTFGIIIIIIINVRQQFTYLSPVLTSVIAFKVFAIKMNNPIV
jgi:hypothetical protein